MHSSRSSKAISPSNLDEPGFHDLKSLTRIDAVEPPVDRPRFPISRRQDPIVTRFRDAAKHHGHNGEVVLDGVHLLLDALRAASRSTSWWPLPISWRTHQPTCRNSGGSCAPQVSPLHEATTGVIEAASPVRTPSGVVAIARWTLSPLATLWAPAPALVLGLVDVQDPGNAGAVIRSADGLGATGVVMIGATADPASPKTMRGAMGSSFRVPVARASLGMMSGESGRAEGGRDQRARQCIDRSPCS